MHTGQCHRHLRGPIVEELAEPIFAPSDRRTEVIAVVPWATMRKPLQTIRPVMLAVKPDVKVVSPEPSSAKRERVEPKAT